jgi:diadenosine tetraphosphate (Ap4A) HIT family hydrolase
MNVAALGNLVPQLHIHVIARFARDAAWPRPVWGVGAAEAYVESEAAALRARLEAERPDLE